MVAIAATAPVLGRLIDIRGPRGVLTITGSLSPLAMLLVFASGDLHLPRAAIAVAAIASGALAPPVTVVIRTLWRYRFDDEGARRTAFAIDGVLLETAYTVGPALIAAVAALASARWAYALAWVFVVATVPILFASGEIRNGSVHLVVHRHPDRHRRRDGDRGHFGRAHRPGSGIRLRRLHVARGGRARVADRVAKVAARQPLASLALAETLAQDRLEHLAGVVLGQLLHEDVSLRSLEARNVVEA